MINYTSEKQLELFDFKTPFNSELSLDNRWIKLSHIVPWDKFANIYISNMSTNGRPGVNPRTVLGAMIIKSICNLDDRGVIEAIQENVYMQFFVGLKEFTTKPVFDASLFVEIRKRVGSDLFDKLNVELIKSCSSTSKTNKKKSYSSDKDEGDDDIYNVKSEEIILPNKGEMQADATVADQYITYPTDSKLLNSSRKKLEEMIDFLYNKTDKTEVKPRTYRREMDMGFLSYSKKKKKAHKTHRRMNRKLLTCLKRNLKHVEQFQEKGLSNDVFLSKKHKGLLEIIKVIYDQQSHMYDNKVNRIDNRIVNLHQPHVRAIPRGKQKSQVEVGAKLGVSLDNGFTRIDTFSWDAYHEGSDLKKQVNSYKSIHGYFPKLVLVDKAYSSSDNRKWLKERGIDITAVPLGRKSILHKSHYQKAKRKKEFARRNHIEAKFGQGKNGYNLNKIRAKLKKTSESWVACIFFIMNLINYQKVKPFELIFECFLKIEFTLNNIFRIKYYVRRYNIWNYAEI